ncbi:hypothetical protein [Pantoea agglomerans]|uniref:hypothetical protein n=1 Tax=Enterobacter agglomerans TaxID=549 RepID=UPI0034CEA2E7
MKNITTTERSLLKYVYSSSGYEISSFSLFKKMKMDMSIFLKSLKDLEGKDLVYYDSTEVKLTQKGINWVTANTIGERNSVKKWEVVPDLFLIEKVDLTDMYIPNIRLLSKKTFDF